MAVEVVRFVDGHLEQVRNLVLHIQQNEFSLPLSLENQDDLQNPIDFYRKGIGEFWVALSGKEVVGTIGLMDIGNRQVILRKMFVKQSFRGKATGIAQALLDTFIDHASGKGARQVYLGTTAQFLAAHRFYEKNGFVLVDEASLPNDFPHMAVHARRYMRELGPYHR